MTPMFSRLFTLKPLDTTEEAVRKHAQRGSLIVAHLDESAMVSSFADVRQLGMFELAMMASLQEAHGNQKVFSFQRDLFLINGKQWDGLLLIFSMADCSLAILARRCRLGEEE